MIHRLRVAFLVLAVMVAAVALAGHVALAWLLVTA